MSDAFRTTIEIAATPDRVFDYFVRPELLVRWMGDVARLEAVAGGLFSVDILGVLIRGHYAWWGQQGEGLNLQTERRSSCRGGAHAWRGHTAGEPFYAESSRRSASWRAH